MIVSDPVITTVLDKEVLNLLEGLEIAVSRAPVPELRLMMTWPGAVSEAYIQLSGAKTQGL